MVLDFIALTVIIIFFIRGYMKGIIVAVFSVLALIAGLACALKLSGSFGQWLLERGWVTSGWAAFLSYVILFLGMVILVRIIAKALHSVVHLAMLGWLNGLIGGLLYAFITALVGSALLWLANQMHLISPETKVYSRTYAYAVSLAPWFFQHVGALLPFAKDIFADLKDLFENVNQTLPEYVGTD